MPTASPSIDYAKLRQDFVRAVARLCPTWLASQRDDLVQAAVMRVMQIVSARPDSTSGDVALASSYLYRVAHSALIDEMRRIARRRETSLDDDAAGAAVERTALSPHDPERVATSRQIGRGIHDCLSMMERDRRLAVTLHLVGHNVPDAAQVLDWPAKRTENLIYRGLADLRKCLMSKGMRP